MKTLLAQGIKFPGSNVTISGPLNGPSAHFKFDTLSSIPSNAITLIFPIAGAILLAMLMFGGFEYITSFGDPKKAELARTRITNALIGIVIIFASYWIVQLVDYIFQLCVYNKSFKQCTP
ncbi:hypothetical protein A3D77_04860 [Candidatus Gottesmanbacteria bacterium RIFCSPHIGHO2_02_FULL_39_11]|uniref:Uncharacterized protein n=1 Tax=Candidatus Gottesmanbacteria bacterium RIFCSPHIGHO2_02_FULL_39_11 TaxID=1798382 RepID=A0A1F5ZLQ2_9BACT|nr:MAG: hypothetical protein A3D77_04860 [Candidatus Gottesmanbacteria bacterium RIFCSPHIGHO2_02_FULL_39_11]